MGKAGESMSESGKSKKQPESSNVLVLLSGGIDSSACVAFYLEQGYCVTSIFVDYGQDAAQKEFKAAKRIAEHYDAGFEKLKWSGFQEKNAGLILGRNAFLLIATLMEIPEYTGILAIGIHSGTEYIDCTPSFIKKMQSIFDMYTHGGLQIGTPFLKWTKLDIWKYCKAHNVPMDLTYSCECGLEQPCGGCLSCRDLEVLYAHA